MTLTNGRSAAELEALLREPDHRMIVNDDGSTTSLEVAASAQMAVDACRSAAEHVRSMGSTFLSIAQSVKTTGDALALDIENRADQFSKMVAMASEYAKQTHDTFEKERDRLDGFKMQGG